MQQLIGTVTSEGLKGDFPYPQGDQHAPFLPWPQLAWHGHLAFCTPIKTLSVLACAQMWFPGRSKVTCDPLRDHAIALLRGDILLRMQPLQTHSLLQEA